MKSISIEGVFLGIAAGNAWAAAVWAAPYMRWAPIVSVLFVGVCLYFSARFADRRRFLRTAVVALIAWPIGCLWQAVHSVMPETSLALVQLAALLVTSQIAALVAAAVISRRKPDVTGL